jgi:hypothetical protein
MQMEVGEQRLAWTQPLDLDGLRLLHLHDHVGAGENLVRVRQNLRADARVFLVAKVDRLACSGLDEHFVAALGQLARRGRRHADAVFVILDFLRHANAHENPRFKSAGPAVPRFQHRDKGERRKLEHRGQLDIERVDYPICGGEQSAGGPIEQSG